MTGSEHIHHDVGAYAIGVLPEPAASQFEAHLAGCDACAAELAALLPVVDLLSTVDAGSVAAALGDDPALVVRPAAAPAWPAAAAGWPTATAGQPAGAPWPVGGEASARPAARRAGHRGGPRSLRRSVRHLPRTLAIAAGVVVLGLSVGVATMVARADRTDRPAAGTAHSPRPAPQPSDGASAAVPPWNPSWPGLSDRGTPAGEHLSTTDPRSGVTLEVYLDAKRWGTQLSISVAHISGPLTCRLIVVGRDGSSEAVSSWGVPAEGYGTAAHPQPLVLPGSTRTARADIARIDLVASGGSGASGVLATLRP